jgi:hypothetical protein
MNCSIFFFFKRFQKDEKNEAPYQNAAPQGRLAYAI